MVTTIRLPDKLHKQLKKEAKQKGMTLNAYIISILWNRGTWKVADYFQVTVTYFLEDAN